VAGRMTFTVGVYPVIVFGFALTCIIFRWSKTNPGYEGRNSRSSWLHSFPVPTPCFDFVKGHLDRGQVEEDDPINYLSSPSTHSFPAA